MRRASARLDIVGRYNTEGIGGARSKRQKKKAVMLKPNISGKRYLSIVWIWGFAPSPHQRAFRFRLFVSATGSNNRKPLWKPSGGNT